MSYQLLAFAAMLQFVLLLGAITQNLKLLAENKQLLRLMNKQLQATKPPHQPTTAPKTRAKPVKKRQYQFHDYWDGQRMHN